MTIQSYQFAYPVGTKVYLNRAQLDYANVGDTGTVVETYAPNTGRNVRLDKNQNIININVKDIVAESATLTLPYTKGQLSGTYQDIYDMAVTFVHNGYTPILSGQCCLYVDDNDTLWDGDYNRVIA